MGRNSQSTVCTDENLPPNTSRPFTRFPFLISPRSHSCFSHSDLLPVLHLCPSLFVSVFGQGWNYPTPLSWVLPQLEALGGLGRALPLVDIWLKLVSLVIFFFIVMQLEQRTQHVADQAKTPQQNTKPNKFCLQWLKKKKENSWWRASSVCLLCSHFWWTLSEEGASSESCWRSTGWNE